MSRLVLAMIATVFAAAAWAQTPPAAPAPRGYDCAKAPNPAQCEERRQKIRQAAQEARKACEGKQGAERYDCMSRQMCARAKDPARCEARAQERAERRQKAAEACKDKQGPELRRCIREHLRAAPRR